MLEIIPTILTNNPEEAQTLISRLNDVILPGGFPLQKVQIDINDGQFLGNKTIEPEVMNDIETDLKIDFHLMTKEPTLWIEKCIRAGADRIIGQIEYMADQIEFVGKVQEAGLKVGLAVDFETEINRLDSEIIASVDVILLLAYPAGIAGFKFGEKVLEKVKYLHEIRMKDLTPFNICVDGGITIDNIKSVKGAGANEMAVGRSVFDGDAETNIEKLLKAAY